MFSTRVPEQDYEKPDVQDPPNQKCFQAHREVIFDSNDGTRSTTFTIIPPNVISVLFS